MLSQIKHHVSLINSLQTMMQKRLFTVPTCYKPYSKNQPYFFQPIDRMFQSGASRPKQGPEICQTAGRLKRLAFAHGTQVASGGAVFLWFHIFFGGIHAIAVRSAGSHSGLLMLCGPFFGRRAAWCNLDHKGLFENRIPQNLMVFYHVSMKMTIISEDYWDWLGISLYINVFPYLRQTQKFFFQSFCNLPCD